jgi:hypothetical protein
MLQYRRKIFILLIVVLTLLMPIKIVLQGNVDFYVFDQKGNPLEGVAIYQMWTRTDFATPKEPTELTETVYTGKDGKAKLPSRYYYFPIWRILLTGTIGILKYHVNYDSCRYSIFHINGIHVQDDIDSNEDRYLKVQIETCRDTIKNYCYYECGRSQCVFIEKPHLTEEELKKSIGITQ